LIAMIASHRSTGKSVTRAVCWMPALFTRMSIAPAELDATDHRLDLGGLRHVGAVILDVHAELAGQSRAQRLDRGGLAEPVDREVRTLCREAARDAQTDPAGRTRAPAPAFP
jgi:hypothetical protein